MTNKAYAAVILLTIIGTVSTGGGVSAQFPGRVTGGIILQIPDDKIDGGIGFELSGDYALYTGGINLYLRPAVEIAELFPVEEEFFARAYQRLYGSLSLVAEKRVDRKWFPFVFAGGGYMSHFLSNFQRDIGFRERDEELSAGPAGHIGAGISGQLHRRLYFSIMFRGVYHETEQTQKQVYSHIDLPDVKTISNSWFDMQSSFGIMLRF